MDPLIVEVLDERGGRVRERHRFVTTPVTVGRGYATDVIVDDPYVDVAHLRLEWTGDGWRAVDLGSANGTHLAASGRRIGDERLAPDTVLRIGHTRLRIRTGEYTAPPALRDRGEAPRLGLWLDRPIVGLAGLAAAGSVGYFEIYQNTYTTEAATTASLWALLALAVITAWASLWALLTRLLSHRTRWAAHLSAACLALVTSEVADVGVENYAFALSARVSAQVLGYGVPAAVGVLALYVHFGLASSRSGWRPAAIAGAVTAAVVAVVASVNYLPTATGDNVHELRFAAELTPLPLSLTRRGTLESFLADAESLRARVDADVQATPSPAARAAR